MANTIKLEDAAAEHSGPLLLENDPLVGREVGGYIVEEPLGEGGMGLVFRARHPILNRHFAIKVLRPEAAADKRISVNFEREAQTLSSLKHPHIIDIVGFGALDDGRQYMVMEFVKGQTLHEELEREGKLALPRALKLADQILDGLEAAHSVGVIHRDMKPSNVLIARVSGGTEVLKLLDFGLAKQQPESIVGQSVSTDAGASVVAGTPEYIAPEQAQGKNAGKHSDLYSFGVVLFEMLTGFLPFIPEETDLDRIRSLLKMHLTMPAPLIGTLAPEGYFPPELEELVADLLKKDPNDRPSSAGTVRSRLQKIERLLQKESTHMVFNPLYVPGPQSQPILVTPPSAVLEGQRGRTRALIATAVALLLLGGVGIRLATRGSTPEVAELPSPSRLGEIAEPQKLAKAAPAPVPPPPPAVIAAPAPVVIPVPVAIPIPRPAPAPAPAPPPRKLSASVSPSKPAVVISQSGCEPNERWRTSARANLQEIQQDAAASSDKKAWAQFEKAEPAITAAIGGARTGTECDAVEQKIEQLARKFKP